MQLVQQQVGSLRFGVVQIVVHEGRVVQIERTEKLRLENGETTASLKTNNVIFTRAQMSF